MSEETNSEKKNDLTARRRTEDVRVVNRLIETVEKKLGGESVRVTLGDYIRLMQLRKELEEEHPKEVRVQWVDGSSRQTDQTEEMEPENEEPDQSAGKPPARKK